MPLRRRSCWNRGSVERRFGCGVCFSQVRLQSSCGISAAIILSVHIGQTGLARRSVEVSSMREAISGQTELVWSQGSFLGVLRNLQILAQISGYLRYGTSLAVEE